MPLFPCAGTEGDGVSHLYDALHLACAEQATVDIFLTTDDRVLRIATRYTAQLKVRVANPLDWLLEVISP